MHIPDRGPIAEPNHPITPHMIDASRHFWDAFDHGETEVSANAIVRFMQAKGGWVPFSLQEIATFFHRHPHADTFPFNRLVEPGRSFSIEHGWVLKGGGWVVRGEDGFYRVTVDFVVRAHKSSPKGVVA